MFNRLLKRGKTSNSSVLMSIETANKIVHDYGNFLQTSAPLPGCVADTKQLPHSKDRIKAAIGVCVKTISAPEITEDLKNGYLMLSAWQNDVGEQILGLNFSQLDLNEDPMIVAETVQQQSDSVTRWKPVIEADLAALKPEFDQITA